MSLSDHEVKEIQRDEEFADRENQKELIGRVGRVLTSALKCPAVAQDRDSVDEIERALAVVATFEATAAETKAKALAAEGRSTRRAKFVESPSEIFMRRMSRDKDSETGAGAQHSDSDFDFSKPGSFAARYGDAPLWPQPRSRDELRQWADKLR
jgi:hypothetical protein